MNQNNNETGSVVDVRSPEEFAGGHIPGSVNIPLPELHAHISELKAMQAPLHLVCASGNRSGMAAMMLQNEGVEAKNAGGWMAFQRELSNV